MKIKTFPRFVGDKGAIIKQEVTECGWLSFKKKIEVIAASDAAGHQVIVKGENIHLLSRPLKTHEEAVKLGNKVVEKKSVKFYKSWFDLTDRATNLFAIFGGNYR